MDYLLWVILALLAYSIVAPLVRVVTQTVPPDVGLFLSTLVFLVIATGVMLATGAADPALLWTIEAGFVYVAGVFLTVGILAYTEALQRGPVSTVVPIFGMFIVGSSLLGIVFLEESLTATRAAGIGCAVIAIYLSAGERR